MNKLSILLLLIPCAGLVAQETPADSVDWRETIVIHQDDGDPSEDFTVQRRNLLDIHVDADNNVWLRERRVSPDSLNSRVREFLANPDSAPHLAATPADAVIRLTNQRDTRYDHYLATYRSIKSAYDELRGEWCRREFGVPYDEHLSTEQRDRVRAAVPFVLIEGTPE